MTAKLDRDAAARALADLESALSRWQKAKEIVHAGWRTDSDLRDRDRLLMELDEAIMRAERFRHRPDVAAALERANRAMMGGPVA